MMGWAKGNSKEGWDGGMERGRMRKSDNRNSQQVIREEGEGRVGKKKEEEGVPLWVWDGK